MKKSLVVLAISGLLLGLARQVFASPISYWRFDEGQGTVAGDSVDGNPGTINGAQWTAGRVGGALSFDGVNDYVSMGDKNNLDFGAADSFTIMAWVKTTKNTGAIVSKIRCPSGTLYEGYMFKVYLNKLYYYQEDLFGQVTSLQSNSIINDGLWHHVAVVRDTATDQISMYVDGQLDVPAVTDTTTSKLWSTQSFEIGRTAYYGQYFEGLIDEVMVYGGALSAAEIEMSFEQGVMPPRIKISPVQFEFHAILGTVNPDVQIMQIRNSGLGILNWGIIENCSWLEVYPDAGQSSGQVNEVTISVDISGLNCGVYDCNLTIVDPCAPNSPQIVPVHLSITGPIIELSATYIEFTAIEGGDYPEEQILTIRNSGSDTLNWKITEDCGWLSVDPNRGSSAGEADDIVLSVDTSSLDGGIYNCELLVSDPNAQNSPQTVTVSLRLRDSDGRLNVPSGYATIQQAIDDACEGDTVVIAEGTYTGPGNRDLDFGGKAITVQSIDPYDPVVVAATIIDCQAAGRGFYFHSAEDANSIVAGLTVKNGKITGTLSEYHAYGGGIYCVGASPTIKNCSILNNGAFGMSGTDTTSHAYGGGICCVSNSRPTIIDCEINGNLARAFGGFGVGANAYGGGVFCASGSTVTIHNSRITANRAHGGKSLSMASWQNYACDSYGGGIYITGTGSTFKNCLFVNNESVQVIGETYEGLNYGKSQGAAIYCAASAQISNCTFSGNYTDPNGIRGEGAGIYGPATAINCIFWGNYPQQISGSSVTYSCVQNGYPGTGNISSNPLFVAGPLGNYYLCHVAAGQPNNSPCVDTGSDTAATLGMNICTTRTDKLWDTGTVDMGYHYSGNVADMDNDGNVDLFDFSILASQWQDVPGVPSADIAPDGGDGIVDFQDLAVLCENYLW